jgi:MFS family permease
MFYRASIAVISPALMRDMDLTSSQLGDISAVFYYAFAAGQVPLGVAIDRIGPRRTMCFLALAAVGGAVVFAVGTTPGHLIAGRALLGIGMSGNMMLLLALLAAWFPVDRFAFLSGTAVAVGTLGNLLAATPLALLSLRFGWRWSFFIFAAVNLAVALAFILVARDRPLGQEAIPSRSRSAGDGLIRLMGMYSYWAISLSNFMRYGFFAALQSLWLGPFLVFGMGRSELEAGNVLFSLGVGAMAGLPLWGSISDRVARSRKKVVLPTMALFCVLTLSMALLSRDVSEWFLLLICFALGFTASSGQITYAHMKELVPESMTAQAITSVNLFTILGAGSMIHILGFFVGSEPSALAGPESFRFLWYVGFAGLALVTALYSMAPDSKAFKAKD